MYVYLVARQPFLITCKMEYPQFKFLYPIQMRWSDLDALGHVNNAKYLTYFEVARSRYVMDVYPRWNWMENMFLIANINVDFHQELKLNAQNVLVGVRLSKIGTKSFVLNYGIFSEDEGKIILHASATSTQVMIDMAERKTIPIPEWMRAALESYESRDE